MSNRQLINLCNEVNKLYKCSVSKKKSAQNGLAYKASNADGHLVREIRGERERLSGDLVWG